VAHGEQVELRGLPLMYLPMQNAALALQAFALLGNPLQLDAIAQVLVRTRLEGRLEHRTDSRHGKNLGVRLHDVHNHHAA
ncbi:bifunctional tetrahydrofolate synthase/dihydrofolate synthase, partial [Pseudomonas syringae pv. tagetis]